MPESSNGGIVLIVLIIISLIVILLSSTGKLLDKPSKLSADASISVIRAQVNTVDTQDQSTYNTCVHNFHVYTMVKCYQTDV